jgi:hypothetical protein
MLADISGSKRRKLEKFETNSKINNIMDMYRGINGFKKVYQPRSNRAKDENGDLFSDSHSNLASVKTVSPS